MIFLETKTGAPRLHRAMLGLTIAYAVFLPFAAFGPTLAAYRLTAVLAMVFSFVVLGVAGYRLGGGRPARVFLLAWGIFLVGNILAALRVTGAAPVNIFTENAQQVGLRARRHLALDWPGGPAALAHSRGRAGPT